jgi:hypothetical protein
MRAVYMGRRAEGGFRERFAQGKPVALRFVPMMPVDRAFPAALFPQINAMNPEPGTRAVSSSRGLRLFGKIFQPPFQMTNNKFSMTNFQFSLAYLVAACRAASLRLCVQISFLSVKSPDSESGRSFFGCALPDAASGIRSASKSSPIVPNRDILPFFNMAASPKTAKFRNWQLPRSVRSDRSDRSDRSGNPQPCRAGLSRRPVRRSLGKGESHTKAETKRNRHTSCNVAVLPKYSPIKVNKGE